MIGYRPAGSRGLGCFRPCRVQWRSSLEKRHSIRWAVELACFSQLPGRRLVGCSAQASPLAGNPTWTRHSDSVCWPRLPAMWGVVAQVQVSPMGTCLSAGPVKPLIISKDRQRIFGEANRAIPEQQEPRVRCWDRRVKMELRQLFVGVVACRNLILDVPICASSSVLCRGVLAVSAVLFLPSILLL